MWVVALAVLILVSVLGTTNISNEPSTTARGRTIGYLLNGSGGWSGRHRERHGSLILEQPRGPGRPIEDGTGNPPDTAPLYAPCTQCHDDGRSTDNHDDRQGRSVVGNQCARRWE